MPWLAKKMTQSILQYFFILLLCTNASAQLRNDSFNVLPDSDTRTFRTDSRTYWEYEDAQREGRYLSPFTFSGGIHSTSASLTSSAFATEAFVPERVKQQSTAITYAAIANDVCYTIISSDTDGIVGWKRVGTTAYYYKCLGSTTPNDPVVPPNSTRLMRLTITGSAIVAVRDDRTLRATAASNSYTVHSMAKCDGSTDNAATIQAELDGVPDGTYFVGSIGQAHSGHIVELPPGVCNISKALVVPRNTILRGQGDFTTLLTCTNGTNGIEVGEQGLAIVLENFAIFHCHNGIETQGENPHILLRNLYIESSTGSGIVSNVVEDWMVDHVEIYNSTEYGWHGSVSFNNIGNSRSTRSNIHDLRILTTGLEGLRFENISQQTALIFSNITVYGAGHHCMYLGLVVGVLIQGFNTEGCSWAADNTYDGLHIAQVGGGASGGLTLIDPGIGGSAANANKMRNGIYINASSPLCTVIGGTAGPATEIKTSGLWLNAGHCHVLGFNGTVHVNDPLGANISGASAVRYGNMTEAPGSGTLSSGFPSIRGKDIIVWMIDSNGDSTGTHGNFTIRNLNATRELLLKLTGDTGVNSGGDLTVRGTAKASGGMISGEEGDPYYFQDLHYITNAPPPKADCNDGAHSGRMVLDHGARKLYICAGHAGLNNNNAWIYFGVGTYCGADCDH